jgi:hypothetical protein
VSVATKDIWRNIVLLVLVAAVAVILVTPDPTDDVDEILHLHQDRDGIMHLHQSVDNWGLLPTLSLSPTLLYPPLLNAAYSSRRASPSLLQLVCIFRC